MIEKYVQADRFLICVHTNCVSAITFLEEKIDEFSRLTISFSVAESGEQAIRFRYEDREEIDVSFRQKARELLFRCPWGRISESTILPMMFRLMVEWLRQRDGEIKLHASGVERDGIVALFLAPSEGGKTSTAMAMCQRYGCLLRANDASVVKLVEGKPVFMRGDAAFRVRYNGLEAYSPQMFAQKTENRRTAEPPWYNKLSLLPEDVGVVTSTGNTPVRFLFFVRLDSMIEGVKVTEYPSDAEARRKFWFKPIMMVLQNITGTIRGSDLIPVDNSGILLPLVLPSLDTPKWSRQRVSFVNTIFSSCRVFQLRGQLEPMAKLIHQLMAQEAQK